MPSASRLDAISCAPASGPPAAPSRIPSPRVQGARLAFLSTRFCVVPALHPPDSVPRRVLDSCSESLFYDRCRPPTAHTCSTLSPPHGAATPRIVRHKHGLMLSSSLFPHLHHRDPRGALMPLHSVCLCCIRLTPAAAVLWIASSWSCDTHTPSPSSARLHAARCLRKPQRAISSPSSRWW